MKQDKEEKIMSWKGVGESNFYKSLDHRSFFFKKAQRDTSSKNMFEELKTIARTPIHLKSDCQLKGGSGPDREFFCTYSSFNIKHIQVYTEEDLQAPELIEDHPINLLDEELLKKNKNALPHMRFLFNDKEILSLTFKILIRVPRENNTTAADKTKIDE